MLNLANVTTTQTVRIPLLYLPQHTTYVLRLFSLMDNELKAEITLGGASLTRAYVTGTVELPAGLPDGEYGYALRCGSDTLSCGLVTVGNYKHQATTHNETIQFKQYAN